MRCPARTPRPEPEGKDCHSSQPPVEAIAVVAERPSSPATRHDAMADAEAPHAQRACHDGTKHPAHLMGMAAARRAASRRASRHQRGRQVASQHTAPPPDAPVVTRYATLRGNLIAAFPRAASAHAPPRPALGAKTRPRSPPRKGRESFPERLQAPFGKLKRIRVSLFFTRKIFRNSRFISFGFSGLGKGAVLLPS